MIELRTLGRVDLQGPDGRELRSIVAGPKRFALLAYLALQNPSGYLRRDTLLGLFWSELDQDRARNALRNALAILRRGLGSGVLVSRGDEEVGLEETRLWCDAVAFERFVDAGDPERGLALYRGDLLEGFFVTGAPEFEHWLETRRTGLRERAAAAAWQLAERQEAEGNAVGAAHWARRAGAFAPYDEDGLRRLIGLLERFRDRSGAIAAYESFAQRLAIDLQLEPTAETRAMIEAVRGGHAQPAPEALPSSPRESPAAEPLAPSQQVGTPASRPGESPAPQVPRAGRRPALVGAGALGLLLGVAGLYFISHKDRGPGPVEASAGGAAPSLAILPFDVRGPGLEVWREGMVDVLSTNLDGVGGVRAINSRTVLARWREATRQGTTPDQQSYLDVASRAGARYMLVGDAVSAGSRLRLAANVYDVASGKSLGAEQVEGSPDSIFSLVDLLSIQILRTIPNMDADELARVNLARATTTSIPALKAYLEGEQLFRRSDFKGAVAAYRRAVEADSTFALPLWKLGSWLSFAQDVDIAGLDRLASLSGRLPRREALLVRADLAIRRGETEAGLSLLKRAVQDYPEDPDVWYELGEIYFHRGNTLLVGPEEADYAFAKTVELDPSFAPAYIHLVNTAFLVYADSARAARLIETYSRLAPGDEADQHNRIAFGLAFGDSALRSRALSALDTVGTGDLGTVAGDYLSSPRFHAARDVVLQRIRARAAAIVRGAAPAGPNEGPWASYVTFWEANLVRGRFRAALEHPSLPELDPDWREYVLYVVSLTGPAELPERWERVLTPSPAADSSGELDVHDFYAAAYAADRGRWGEYEKAQAHLRRSVKISATEGDSATASALEGYGFWRRGRAAQAVPILEDAQRRLPPGRRNNVVRWWLGKLLLETGRSREAQRYFTSCLGEIELEIPATYFLAKTYEAQGAYERARQTYAYVAAAWSDADPEARPVAEDARTAEARLSKDVSE